MVLRLQFLFFCFLPLFLFGQSTDQIRERATRFLQQGDYGNAIIILKNLIQKDSTDIESLNNLGIAYYMAKEYKTGYELMVPIAESDYATDMSFVIAALNLRGGKNNEEAGIVYKLGMQKFPKSGALFADYGDYLQNAPPDKDGKYPSIDYWEKGIRVEPNYPLNYYHAAKYYLNFNDSFWAMLYGEIFLNLETYSNRTVEIKALVYEAAKKLFAFDLEKKSTTSPFEIAVRESLSQQSELTVMGINPEILSAIRTRFILHWNATGNKSKFLFPLFEYHQHLLQSGYFDAYNQWIFGSAENIGAFQNWTKLHPEEYAGFNQDRRRYIFSMAIDQGVQ